MKSNQENKLSMYYAVQRVCAANNLVWGGLPAFVSGFNDFKTSIGKIETILKAQERGILGVAKDKDAIQDSMIDLSLRVAGAVFAYASDTSNLTLKGKVNYSRSELKRVRDSISGQRCQVIADEANTVIGVLATYGIVPADITLLRAKIIDFTNALSAPRTAIAERKGATDELTKQVRKTDVLLKEKLDKLIEKFKVSSVDFYKLYFDARRIVDIGVRHELPVPVPIPPPPTPNPQ